MDVIQVSHLSKVFAGGLFEKDFEALKDVNFSVRPGRAVGFIGSNGSGKTTTIKCLLNFIVPTSGEVLLFGKPIDETSKARLGYLSERPYMYTFLTGQEYLRLHWDLSGASGDFKKTCEPLLHRVNLHFAADRKIKNYSKGMLQRLGFAQALLTSPELLVLDEPMSGLDPDGRALMKEMILEQKMKGTTLFFSSHLLSDVEEICDDIVLIDKGSILFCGTKQEFEIGSKGMEEAYLRVKKGETQSE
jgi:ABC-2 type transport system ATP-binding protein